MHEAFREESQGDLTPWVRLIQLGLAGEVILLGKLWAVMSLAICYHTHLPNTVHLQKILPSYFQTWF